MKKFFIAVISLVIIAMAAYGIAYVVMPVNSIELNRYTHSVSFVCDNAYIARDEAVYYSNADGIVHNIARDGDRVAQDEEISTVYNGDVNDDLLKQLNTIDLKISKLKARSHDSELYSSDSESSESAIANKLDEVSDLAAADSVEEIHAIKNEINSIRKNTDISLDTQIEALNSERGNIEYKISGRKSEIVSDRSGIFSSYVDGLESVLIPSKIEDFSIADIKKLNPKSSEYLNGKQIVSGTPVCKVMNNHIWYIVGIADSDRVKLMQEKKNITVRFTNLTETDVSGEISYISEPDEDGNSVFMVKVGTYLESAFSYRTVNAQIIFNEYSGYKVPTDAIRTGEGISDYYVYARKGSEAYKCDVDVLYSDTAEGYSIIQSKQKAANNLGSMDRLVVGER